MKNYTIYNKTKEYQTVTLHHQDVCVKIGKCLCKKGRPDSVHFAPDCVTKDVQAHVLLSRDAQHLLTKPVPALKAVETMVKKGDKKPEEPTEDNKGSVKGKPNKHGDGKGQRNKAQKTKKTRQLK